MDNATFLPLCIMLISFVAMLSINTPIAVSICLSTFITLVAVASTVPIPSEILIAHRIATGMESFALMAIPLFIVSGHLMGQGGMARRIMDFAGVLLGKLPGGLALANVFACMLFGSISGSAAAAVSSIGGCMIPEMRRKNYPPEMSVAVTATAATTGLLIPPSNVMIVYAMSAGSLSISSLFLAGILPGILVGVVIMIFALVLSAIYGYGKVVKTGQDVEIELPKMGLLKSFLLALPSLSIGVVVLGGIISGVFTATEAAAVAVLYAFIFAVFIYKEIKIADIGKLLLESGITSGVILLLIGASGGMSWVLSYLDIPVMLSEQLLNLSDNKWVILILINICLLLVGTFMDMTPAILIFTPILLPVMVKLGIDPIHFGIFMIANLCVGLCTPPVGTCLFVGCTVGKTKLLPTTLAMVPYFIAMLIGLIFIVAFPQLSLYLPGIFK